MLVEMTHLVSSLVAEGALVGFSRKVTCSLKVEFLAIMSTQCFRIGEALLAEMTIVGIVLQSLYFAWVLLKWFWLVVYVFVFVELDLLEVVCFGLFMDLQALLRAK